MTPTPEDIRLADTIVRLIAKHDYNGEAMFELDISRRHADLPAAHYTAQMIAAHTAPLRELAEIGRLAVELARAAQGLDFDACSAKGEELGKASAAYLAKQESKP